MRKLLFLAALVFHSGLRQMHAAPLMRFPTASRTEIAFVAQGQLWTAPLQGGAAHRLTQDAGTITTPLF